MRRIEVTPEIASWLARQGATTLEPHQLEACTAAGAVMDRARKAAARWTEHARGEFRTARDAARLAGRAEGMRQAASEVALMRASLDAHLAEQETFARGAVDAALRTVFERIDDAGFVGAAVARAVSLNALPELRAIRVADDDARHAADAALGSDAVPATVDAQLVSGTAEIETERGRIVVDRGRIEAAAIEIASAEVVAAQRAKADL
ncbi:hypothetical protein [Jannaschia sp. LMIT008]|uniref:hypothetical protein n=1 Tax=Jannaschia maritima TaxID=3032585 RepID=UPI00281216E6|nr:hypothetical protein [Jannaschia sp. LMIT008]